MQFSEGAVHLVGALRPDRGPSGSERRPVDREVIGPEHGRVRSGPDRLDNIITVPDRISRLFGNTLEALHATPPTRLLRSSRPPATDPLHPSRERSLHMGMLSSFDGVCMSMPLQPRPRQSVRREVQCPHAWICHGSQAASPQEAEFLADRVQPATAPRSSQRRFRR